MDLYPKTFIGYIIVYLKQLYYTINVFESDQKKIDQKKTSTYRVIKGMIPSEVKWENLEYSQMSRLTRIIVVYFLTFILIGVGFGIIIYLNYVQSTTGIGKPFSYTTGISIVISLVISIINFLIFLLLRSLTR